MIVYTGGTFDGLHVGHLELLRACRDLAGSDGRVVVGLNTDGFVQQYKGKLPQQTYREREEMLRACRLVDLVVCNVGGSDSSVVIDVVGPDLIAIGDDWLDPDHDEGRYLTQLGITPSWMADRGLRVEYVPRTRGVSSSARRKTSEEFSGHRVEGEHDCFMLDCRGLRHELQSVRRALQEHETICPLAVMVPVS